MMLLVGTHALRPRHAWFTYPGSHADREWQELLCYSAYYRHISYLEKIANHAILLLVGISRAVLLLLRTEKRPCDARWRGVLGRTISTRTEDAE